MAKRAFWAGRGRARAPIPPESLRLGVGPGDYHEAGRTTLALLERLTGVKAADRVLDVGCGLGRIAWPLSERLGKRGSYTGLDVVKAYTDWCEANLGLDPERFRFHHADVQTSFYNPGGSIGPGAFVFPWAAASFTLAIATSLFTHLGPDAAAHYLREIARTLAPNGRLFASFYLLDARGREAAATGATDPTFFRSRTPCCTTRPSRKAAWRTTRTGCSARSPPPGCAPRRCIRAAGRALRAATTIRTSWSRSAPDERADPARQRRLP